MIESIIKKFKQLKLKTCADNIIPVIEGAKEENWSALKIIEHLLDLELEIREKNRISLRFKQSSLLKKPTIDQFDFDFHLSRRKQKKSNLNPNGPGVYQAEKGHHFDWQSRSGEKLFG